MKIITALLAAFLLAIFAQMLYVDYTYPDYTGMIKQKKMDFEKAHEDIMTLYSVMESNARDELLLKKNEQEIARLHMIENSSQASLDSLEILEQKRQESKWSSKLLNALGI